MAGIMDRLSRLIRANVNDLIDNAEDPEKMIDQILRDMQESISMARAQVAAMIAQEKARARRRRDQEAGRGMGSQGGASGHAGKMIPREALRRKRDNEENSAIYSEQRACRARPWPVEGPVAAAGGQVPGDPRCTRHVDRAPAPGESATTGRRGDRRLHPLDPSSELDRMERKIRSEEAHAAAALEIDSFEAQFQALEAESDVEDELEALKKSWRSTPDLTSGT